VHVEAQGAEYAVFSIEERGAPALVRAFGDVVGFWFVECEGGGVEEGRGGGEGGEVGVDVYDAARGFRVGGKFGGEVERGGGYLLRGLLVYDGEYGWLVSGMVTSAPNSTKLPPSGPSQNRMKTTMACAITSCGRRRSIPAAWVRLAPAKRTESSRSADMPSSSDPEVSRWATVANELVKGEGCVIARV
jgi:hypothetical protein